MHVRARALWMTTAMAVAFALVLVLTVRAHRTGDEHATSRDTPRSADLTALQPALRAAEAAAGAGRTGVTGVAGRRALLRTVQPAAFDLPERISAATAQLELVPLSGRGAPRSDAGRGVVAYRDAWPGVDVVRHASSRSIKESIVVRRGARSGTFAWRTRGNALLRRAPDGGLRILVRGRTTALTSPAPVVLDAEGATIAGSRATYRLGRAPGGGQLLRLVWSVPERTRFPFNVDPTFTTGQAASAVIGTTSFTDTTTHQGRSNWGLADISGIAAAGTKLLISERYSYGHSTQKIWYYNTVPTTNGATFDGGIGHANSGSTGFYRPFGIWSDGTKVAVVDYYNNRVMLWNSFPPNSSTPADVVLGQPNFTSVGVNTGGISASTLRNPQRVWFDGTNLIVSDTGNHRVLIWNSWPTSNGQAANLVLGQADMVGSAANRGGSVNAGTLNNPTGVWSDGTVLFVADRHSHRLLRWDAFPTTNGQSANVAIGQSTMTGSGCNALAGKQGICYPEGITGSAGSLYLADYGNHRALRWTALPTSMGQTADVEIGQRGVPGTTSSLLRAPNDVAVIGTKLAVSDAGNYRVLIWDTIPATDAAAADHVVGHTTFTHGGMKDGHGDVLMQPYGVAFDSAGRLYVGNGENTSILRFPASLPAVGATADLGLGQSAPGDYFVGGSDTRGTHVNLSISPDDKLVSADWYYGRATWWNTLPSVSPTTKSGVVGQPTLTSLGMNRGGAPTRATIGEAMDAAWDGSSHFAVADRYNHRVLIWNSLPTNGQAADVVLGQPDGTSTLPNNGGLSSSSLNAPWGVRFWAGKLVVTDTLNNRVLVWNTIPTTDNTPADVVVGQPTMSSSLVATNASTLVNPRGLDIADGALVVADSGNRRVLVYDSIPVTNGAAADRVIGQPNMGTATCSITQTGMCYPNNVALRAGRLAVSDNVHRVLVYDDVLAPTITGLTAVAAGERATFTYETDEFAATEVVYDTVSHPGGSGYASSTGIDSAGRSHRLVATGLTPGATYYYRIAATDSHGNVHVSDEYSVAANNVSTFVASPSFGDDASIFELDDDHNYGRSAALRVGGAGAGTRWRSLLRFDLSQIPAGATVTNAALTLHATNAGAGTSPSIAARQMSSTWDEGVGDGAPQPDGVTWATSNGIDPWTSPGGDALVAVLDDAPAPAATPGSLTLDVTSAVSDWVTIGAANEGIQLAALAEPATDTVEFASGDHADTTLRPQLVVDWQGSDVTNPQLSSVRTRMLSSTSIEVSWDTDEAATSAVDFGTTASYTGGTVSDPSAVNHHVVVLDDLDLSTIYHLRARSTDAQGNEGASPDTLARTSYREVLGASDTFVRQDMPNRNNGGQASLFVGNANGTWQRTNSFLHFDTSPVPPTATIRSATLQLTSNAQADSSTPTYGAYALATSFTEGTGNASLGPPQVLTAGQTVGGNVLPMPAERHLALTSRGWFAIFPFYSAGQQNVRYRRSYDGMSFGGDAIQDHNMGRSGVALDQDGSTLWYAMFADGTSTLTVRRVDDATATTMVNGTLAFASTVTEAPSVRVAGDGYLWAKAESITGEVWVARSTNPRDPSSWGAPVQLAAQASPGHAVLVPLAGSSMALLAQDGATISLRTWDGASWSGASMVTAAAAVTDWTQTGNMAAVRDGTGGIWLVYRTAADDVVAMHYATGVWGVPETVQAGGAGAVAITLDTGRAEPHVAWLSGTSVMTSARASGTWSAGATLQSGITTGYTQLSMSLPSDEAIGVVWAEPSGANGLMRWRGFALDKGSDGASWNTSDGTTPWTSPGGDEAVGAALDTEPAPGAVGGELSMDLTSSVTAWHAGAPNHGFVLRKETDGPGLNDWKSFYSSEATTPSLRPRVVVDYDIASVTLSQPTAATTWRAGQTAEVTWQTSGTGLTHVSLFVSDDGGGSWSPIVANEPNTGSYFWQVPAVTDLYRIKIEALSLGVPIAEDESPDFVVEDVPPSPVTDLAGTSPSASAVLTWTAPADTGGAGMANGTYRVYRSAVNGAQGSRIATVSAATYTDNSALADGPWYYTVIPVDAAGNAQPVGNNQATVQHDGSPPDAVADLAAPGLTNQPVALTWSAVADTGPAGTSGYRVYRSTVAGVRGTLLRTVATTSDADTPPLDGTYYYTITAVDAAGNVRLTGNTQVAAVYDTTAPSPVSVSLDAGVSWTSSRNVTASLGSADAVDVQLSDDNTFAAASWTAVAATLPFQLADADGGHTVYARFRDLAGNVSATVSDGIGLDRTQPSTVTPLRDGTVASDIDYQTSTTELRATWTAATDAHSGLSRYDLCLSTAPSCGGTVVSNWASVGTATSATVGALTLTEGQVYFACVRSVDGIGNVLSPVACTDGVTVTSVDSAAPGTIPQGRRSQLVVVDGSGFDPAATASVSGTDVTITATDVVDPTRIELTVDVASSGVPGTRDLVITSPDGTTASLIGAITVAAPTITVGIATLDHNGTDHPLSTVGPFGVDLGAAYPGTVRTLGPADSGQAVAGSALDLDVVSNTDWSVSGSATNFSGPAALAASTLSWKHHGVSEVWTPFGTAPSGMESLRVPNAPSSTTFAYDLQWSIPLAQAAGPYSTTMTLAVLPAP